jgi:acetyl esterase/lipase
VKTYRLWEGNAPLALGTGDHDIPTLTDWGEKRDKALAACVVCPGGGYVGLADYEGWPIAEFLEKIGIRGFVLKYRLGPKYHHPAMLWDGERAIRFLRANQAELGIDPYRVGIIGFSAGGHLASTVCTHNTVGKDDDADPVERESSRPDWAGLFYPVITMRDGYVHPGSRENLLGPNPSESLMDDVSNERAVSLSTPPTFIVHSADDSVVPVENSLEYAMALADHRVPFEMYVPQDGSHGFGIGEAGHATDWRDMFARWASLRGLR